MIFINPLESKPIPRVGFFGFQSHPKRVGFEVYIIPFLGHTNGFLGYIFNMQKIYTRMSQEGRING